MQITLVTATLLLLGVASATDLLGLEENDYVKVQCQPRGDVTIDAAVLERSKSCLVEVKSIAPFDRSDDGWKFAWIGFDQKLQLHGIKEALIVPNYPLKKLFIAYA